MIAVDSSAKTGYSLGWWTATTSRDTTATRTIETCGYTGTGGWQDETVTVFMAADQDEEESGEDAAPIESLPPRRNGPHSRVGSGEQDRQWRMSHWPITVRARLPPDTRIGSGRKQTAEPVRGRLFTPPP